MIEFGGVLINPFKIAYCEVVEPYHQRPELYVTLTNGDTFSEIFDTIDDLRDVLDEISEFVNPLVGE